LEVKSMNNTVILKNFIERIKSALKDNLGLLIGFLIMCLVLSFSSDAFLTTRNLYNVMRQITVNVFLACGMTLVILIGGIDLSVGSIIAVSGCLSAGLITNSGLPVVPAILLAVLAGCLLGVFNGLVISKTKIPAFIITLAMMNVGRGFARIYTHETTILVQDQIYTAIGTGKIFGDIPVHIVYMLIVIVIVWFILNRTRFGRHIYAVGDNWQAAVFAGINVQKVIFLVYLISGFLASCAGILSATRTFSGQFSVGAGTEMDAISAVVLGGTSMLGGVGSLAGTVLGCLIIGVLSNGMNLLGINSSWQYVVKGFVLLLAVFIDYLKGKNK
jgi:ribose transport system permease protein